MVRGSIVTLFAVVGSAVAAEPAPLRFRFQAGESYTFAVTQKTTVAETTRDEQTGKLATAGTVTKLALTRKWDVKAVDEKGVATLDMAITAMRQEIIRPGPLDRDGKPTADTVVVDSATPEGQKQMAEYLGKPIVTVKLDARGQLLDAKAAGGTPDRLAAELPFRVALPEQPPAANAAWVRPFAVKLAPPLGTGESYDAAQAYSVKGTAAGGYTVIGLTTTLKTPPKDAAEWPPLVPLLWEGEVYFHAETGRYAGARLGVKKEIPNHQGEGTKFVYQSEYTEGVAK
jgi:hypothetical protein